MSPEARRNAGFANAPEPPRSCCDVAAHQAVEPRPVKPVRDLANRGGTPIGGSERGCSALLLGCGAEPLHYFFELRPADLGKAQVQAFQSLNQRSRDHKPREGLAVGWHHVQGVARIISS